MSFTSSLAQTASSRRWLASGSNAAAQFMVIKDTSIVGIAPPEIQADFGFTPSEITICSLHVPRMASLEESAPDRLRRAAEREGIPPSLA